MLPWYFNASFHNCIRFPFEMSSHLLTLQKILFRDKSQRNFTVCLCSMLCPTTDRNLRGWFHWDQISLCSSSSLKLTILCFLSARILDKCHPSWLSLLFLYKVTALTIYEILAFFAFIVAQPNCMPQSHQSNLLSKPIFLQNSKCCPFLKDQIMFLNWHGKSSTLQQV